MVKLTQYLPSSHVLSTLSCHLGHVTSGFVTKNDCTGLMQRWFVGLCRWLEMLLWDVIYWWPHFRFIRWPMNQNGRGEAFRFRAGGSIRAGCKRNDRASRESRPQRGSLRSICYVTSRRWALEFQGSFRADGAHLGQPNATDWPRCQNDSQRSVGRVGRIFNASGQKLEPINHQSNWCEWTNPNAKATDETWRQNQIEFSHPTWSNFWTRVNSWRVERSRWIERAIKSCWQRLWLTA